MVAGSFVLHFVTIILYLRVPDRFTAFTVFPIWVWCGIGLLLSGSAFLFFRFRLSLLLSAIWTITFFLMADEARSLGRLGKPLPYVGHPENSLRVITFNCHSSRDLITSLRPYNPDIVFLQEITSHSRVKKLAQALFADEADFRHYPRKSCAVIVRGKISHYLRIHGTRCQMVTARLLRGPEVQLMNVHLTPAETNLRLWRRDCWQAHFHSRLRRRAELAVQLAILRQKTPANQLPTIIAGDFNAPPQDATHRLLERHYVNTFSHVGTGWGNSFPSSFPIVRIDHIYASPDLIPERCAAISIPNSDHRMIVADFFAR